MLYITTSMLMTERIASTDSMTLMKLSKLLLLYMGCLCSLMLTGRVVSELGDLRTGKYGDQMALHEFAVDEGGGERTTVHHVVAARRGRMTHFVRVMVVLSDDLALELLLIKLWRELGCIVTLDNSDC